MADLLLLERARSRSQGDAKRRDLERQMKSFKQKERRSERRRSKGGRTNSRN